MLRTYFVSENYKAHANALDSSNRNCFNNLTVNKKVPIKDFTATLALITIFCNLV